MLFLTYLRTYPPSLSVMANVAVLSFFAASYAPPLRCHPSISIRRTAIQRTATHPSLSARPSQAQGELDGASVVFRWLAALLAAATLSSPLNLALPACAAAPSAESQAALRKAFSAAASGFSSADALLSASITEWERTQQVRRPACLASNVLMGWILPPRTAG